MAWPSARYAAFRLVEAASRRLPSGTAVCIAERLADGYARVAAMDRAAVRHNLELLADQPAELLAGRTREVFRHFARYLVEFFTMHDPDRVAVAVDGQAGLRAAQDAGRGAVVLTMHLGNWEAGAAALRRLGFTVAAVALPHHDPALNALFDRQRARCGVHVIPLGRAATPACVRWLRQGRVLGLLGDQAYGADSVQVPFGRGRLRLPRGPAVLSLRTGALVFPTFVIREAPGRLRLRIGTAIRPEEAQGSDRAADLTRRYAAALYEGIQHVPEQWIWFQRIETA